MIFQSGFQPYPTYMALLFPVTSGRFSHSAGDWVFLKDPIGFTHLHFGAALNGLSLLLSLFPTLARAAILHDDGCPPKECESGAAGLLEQVRRPALALRDKRSVYSGEGLSMASLKTQLPLI